MAEINRLTSTSIIRRKPVQGETGYSRSTLYNRINQGLFTKPVKLGPRSVGWPAMEVAAINAARIAGKTDAEIRALVIQLEESRALVNRDVPSKR